MSTNDPFATPTGDGQQPAPVAPQAPAYGAPAPMAPQYGAPPAAPVYNAYQQPYMSQMNQSTNGMAIASLVCIFVFMPLALIFGIVALNQIKKTGAKGRGMALAGVIVGGIWVAAIVIILIAALASS